MTFAAFVATVEAFTGRPARQGRRGVMLACPNHQDRRESLSAAQTPDRILIHDFGGCRAEEIVRALGLTMGDLFETPKPGMSKTMDFDRLSAIIEMSRHQAWARPGVLEMYEAADAMRWADRVRCRQTEDACGAWDTLTATAAVTTAAEDLWAWAVEAELCGR